MPHVVVIGAGPAGLAAGHELARQGCQPLVLEQSNAVGGISRTEVHRGCRLDIGGHRFFTKMSPVRQAWEEMLGGDFLTVSRLSRIYYNGRFFKYPLELGNTLRNLGFTESLLCVLSYFRAQLSPIRDPQNFEQWVTNRFGERLYRTFFQVYTEKVWGIPCNVLQADWAAQRIGTLTLGGALRNAIIGQKGVRTLVGQFRYPRLGPGMMWERYHRRLCELGGQVRLGGEAVQLHREGRRLRAVTVTSEGGPVEIPCDHVISSMALADVIAALQPAAPAEVCEAARALKYRAFILVGLLVEQEELFADNWIYVHSPAVRVGRIQNYRNWSRDMVAGGNQTSLGMEYFCSVGDEMWTKSDESLLEQAAGELAALGLARREEIQPLAVIREGRAYPVYDPVYRQSLQIIREYLTGLENLQVIGRNGMHRYNNQDHSMMTGILAARNVLGERHDVWSVNTEAEYAESEKR